jgi:hypothetical protein
MTYTMGWSDGGYLVSYSVPWQAFCAMPPLIQVLELQLLPWFNAVNQDATQFSISTCPWQDIAAVSFPDPILGLLLVTIVDKRALSPLLDMHHGPGWYFNCDCILFMGILHLQTQFWHRH